MTKNIDKPAIVKVAWSGGTTPVMTIPKHFANNLGIEKGDYVRLSVTEDNKVIIEKAL